MGNEKPDVGMSCSTYVNTSQPSKLTIKCSKIYAKVNENFYLHFVLRHLSTIVNKSQNKITQTWDKSRSATLSKDLKLIEGCKTQEFCITL